MSYTITVIGAIGESFCYQEADILRLLNSQQVQLLHGNTFTGRPATQVYIDNDCVLKIRSEIRLDAFLAKRWATQALEKERTYQVHHPYKTWFIAEAIQTSKTPALIGNLCPRLQALHELLVTPSSPSILKELHWFSQLFEDYFRLANSRQIRLDEGLSNFGLSNINGIEKIYYLDDDIYSWDRFVSCAHGLGVYFRSLPWLTPQNVVQLGQIIRQLILKHFNDTQYLIVLAEQLKDICFPNERQREVVKHFIHQLDVQPSQNSQPSTSLNYHNCRYLAILADVHANLPALRTVLAYLQTHGIKEGIVLGDIVGYGPHPSQCVEEIQETGFLVIKGNHDHALATGHWQKGFSRTAAWALEWSESRITAEQKVWLAELPPLFQTEHWLAVHGAPIDPTFFNAYVYEMTYSDNLDILQRKKIYLCFHGHTHQPGVYGRKGVIDSRIQAEIVALKLLDYALICPGSVGQPRNKQLGAQFAIYDQQEEKVYYHNLLYDAGLLIERMNAEGFPNSLINFFK
jgi:predicted phosphodiesterase